MGRPSACVCVWESVRLHFASTCTCYWPWTGLTCSGQGMGGLSVCLSPRLFYLLGCGSQVQLSLACVHWVHWATALCYSDGLGMRALWLEDPPPFLLARQLLGQRVGGGVDRKEGFVKPGPKLPCCADILCGVCCCWRLRRRRRRIQVSGDVALFEGTRVWYKFASRCKDGEK